MRQLVFLDTETTGLDPDKDKIFELAYAVGNSQITTLYFGITSVSSFIDEFTKFTERGVHLKPKSSDEEFEQFLKITKDQTMVAANPSFDSSFLKKAGLWNMSHRMLDIESYAMARLNLDYVPSMKELHELLSHHGHTLPAPNHSASGDVITMRSAYYTLLSEFESTPKL